MVYGLVKVVVHPAERSSLASHDRQRREMEVQLGRVAVGSLRKPCRTEMARETEVAREQGPIRKPAARYQWHVWQEGCSTRAFQQRIPCDEALFWNRWIRVRRAAQVGARRVEQGPSGQSFAGTAGRLARSEPTRHDRIDSRARRLLFWTLCARVAVAGCLDGRFLCSTACALLALSGRGRATAAAAQANCAVW